MNDTVKLGAAVAGGYLLGRTRKGKAAIGLALWLAGRRGRGGMVPGLGSIGGLLSSPEVSKITGQLRGPLVAAAQRAATSVIESRTSRLADSLSQRTALISGSGSGGRDSGDQGSDDQESDGGDQPADQATGEGSQQGDGQHDRGRQGDQPQGQGGTQAPRRPRRRPADDSGDQASGGAASGRRQPAKAAPRRAGAQGREPVRRRPA